MSRTRARERPEPGFDLAPALPELEERALRLAHRAPAFLQLVGGLAA
jgi:hypothetical protein